MNVPGGIRPLQTFDIGDRPIHILEKAFPTCEQVGIDCEGEVSPILIIRITGQTSSCKRVRKELYYQSETRAFWATIESQNHQQSRRRTSHGGHGGHGGLTNITIYFVLAKPSLGPASGA